MKKSKLPFLAFCALGIGTTLISGCNKFEVYEIDAPSTLKDKIDSIAEANNPQRGDTLRIDILTPLVGAEDNSSGFWTEFSDYFTVPTNRMLHLEFYNYTSGEGNWNNWDLCVCNGERDGSDYSEYFVLRADAWGWDTGTGAFDIAMVQTDYADNLIGDDMWAVFREKMQGAYVYMDIDHSKTGNVFVTAKHVATDGTTFTESYQQPVSATADINAFLICDGSHYVIKKAYTITSKVQEVEDQPAVSITVTGQPEAIEIGDEDIWGNAVATVTYADGSSAEANYNDITFTIPDLTTVGTKTILYSYSKTKQGNYGPAVAGYYTIEVNNAISDLCVTKMPNVTTYYFYDGVIAPVFTQGIEVEAIYVDGSVGSVPLANLTFSQLKPEAGKQEVTITCQTTNGEVTTSYPVDVIQGTGVVGAPDFTNAWWTTFTEPDKKVEAGTSVTFKMTTLSDNLGNWHSPCTILRNSQLTEYAVLRQDNWGWGTGYDGNPNVVAECDWNWDTFMPNINGSEVVITVTNNGDGTATVRYDVEYANGEVHFQQYSGIAVDSSDLNTALVTEESCLILHE